MMAEIPRSLEPMNVGRPTQHGYVTWALKTLFFWSSAHFNTDALARTGVLVRRLPSYSQTSKKEAVKAEAQKLAAAGHKAIAVRCDVSDDAQVAGTRVRPTRRRLVPWGTSAFLGSKMAFRAIFIT